MEVDTGASLSLIPASQFEKCWPKKKPQAVINTTANIYGELLNIKGEVDVEVEYGQKTYSLTLIVVDAARPSLLGRDWLPLIKLDWAQIHAVHAVDVNDLVRKHETVFREELGCIQGTTAKLHVEANMQPRFYKARVVPYRDEVTRGRGA